MNSSDTDISFMEMAIEIALNSEKGDNLPIGALITLEDKVIAEGYNAVRFPLYNPGKHSEMQALRNVPVPLWPRSREMTCYTTLEPCIMCFGSLILHGIGRIVYGAVDPRGGAGYLINNLPEYYEEKSLPELSGPLMPQQCDPLYKRAAEMFEKLG